MCRLYFWTKTSITDEIFIAFATKGNIWKAEMHSIINLQFQSS
jgi:hypothetical protein